jgi:uncharacterized protein (DUF58 family)
MNVRSTLLLGVAGLVAAALLRSEVLVFAAIVVVLIASLAFYTGRHILDRVEYSRSLSRRVVAWGGEVEVSTTIANRKWLPLMWLRVRDDWPSAVQPSGFTLSASHRQATETLAQALSVRWYQRVRRRYRGLCAARGVHAFGPARLEAGDPLGLSVVIEDVETRDELVVLPKTLQLPEEMLAALGRPLVGAPSRRSLIRDPSGLIGIRPYRPGDPLKSINWRATARTRDLQTNEFEPSTEAEVLILLNLRTFEFAWQGIDPELMELLCVVAASVASAFAEHDLAVGLSSNGVVAHQRGPIDVDPAPGTLPEILDGLARIALFPAPPFGRLLQRELQATAMPAEYLVVTSSLAGEITPCLLALKQARPTQVVAVGGLSDQAEGADLIDWRVSRDFDWRNSHALALA